MTNTNDLVGSEDARALHAAYPAIDLHDDVLMWVRWAGYDLAKRHTPPLPDSRWLGHVDLPRLRAGGMGAQFFGLVSLPVLGAAGCTRAVDEQIDLLDGFATANPDQLRKVRSADAIARANDDGVVAALLGIEGAHALEGDIRNVAHFAQRGVRYLGLSHFSANEACFPSKGRGSSTVKSLTPFGVKVVEQCLEHGVILDLAHINRPGFMQAAAMSKAAGKPTIVSHTGVLGAFEHWRNIDDDQLRAVADGGGVIGVIFVPGYLGGPGIETVVKHMEHIVNVVGEDHVALGSDYDGMVTPTEGLTDISMLPNLTDALIAAKWSEGRIAKTLRTNVLRVLADAPPKWDLP